jgi:hypothetical protein
MERVTPLTAEQLTQNLRQANASLWRRLETLAPAAHPGPISPSQMNALLSELMRIGQCLRAGLPKAPDSELNAEIVEYRRNVERLRDLLPFIHTQLVRERARLEAERARLESAENWARSSGQTL